MPIWLFHLTRLTQRLWVTVGLYSLLGLGAALAAAQFAHLVPSDFPLKLGSESVDDILSILASSMLAVATFSLTTLVTAYTSIVGNAAPHAAQLLVSQGGIRSSLATFVGAFIYSIVGIVALHTGYYGSEGRVILFFVTLVVLLLVVLAMLRWIGQLSSLGQVADVVERVAEATSDALASRPMALARRSGVAEPQDADRVLHADTVGFVQNIDVDGLEEIAAGAGLIVRVEVVPGAFVHAGAPIISVLGPSLTASCAAELRSKVSIGGQRTFDQDPRFGLTVLGEIAGRALSKGVNDPGTARDVIASTTAILSRWADEDGQEERPCPHVLMPALDTYDMLHDALEPVARLAADNPVLHGNLQSALFALTWVRDKGVADAARRMSLLALDYAKDGLKREADVTTAIAQANAVLRRTGRLAQADGEPVGR